MTIGLLALDENLASSIALRYASLLAKDLPLRLQAVHVEVPDINQFHASGTGWVQRTWERGMKDAAQQAIQRLLNTEKVEGPFIGFPKILIGDRDHEFLQELHNGCYDLFIEGNLNTSDITDFYKLVSSPLYTKTPCPILVVKNLVSSNTVALFCGDGADYNTLILQAIHLLKSESLSFDLIFYRYKESETTISTDKKEAGSVLFEAEKLLQAKNIEPVSIQVVTGTPKGVAEMLKKYRLVVSSFPVKNCPRFKVLAQCPSPVLLCKYEARKQS